MAYGGTIPETQSRAVRSFGSRKNIHPNLRDPLAIFAFRISRVQEMTQAVFGPAVLLVVKAGG
jgi:hypothetical protein